MENSAIELYNHSIYNIIRRNAAVRGGRPSLRSGDIRVTHRELLAHVDRLAFGLIRLGLGKGDRIAVLGNNSLEYVFLLGAAARIGAVVIPINCRLKPGEIEHILRDGTPKAVVVDPEYLPVVESLSSIEAFIGKRFVIGERCGDFESFSGLMAHGGDLHEAGPGLEDPFLIIHTAAVQGKSRGAVLSHRNFLFANLHYICSLGLTEEDVYIGVLPLFHVAGLGMLFATMHAGGVNLLTPKFDADLILEHIEKDKATLFFEFPPMLKTLLETAEKKGSVLSSLRHVVGLDQPETVKRFEEMTGATFWTGYGQTETSGFVSFAPYFQRAGSAGLPNFVSEIGIVDENGAPLDAGKTGEILVRGPMVFHGYWNRNEDNRRTFRGEWHHTGDMGSIDEGGYLWYAGRTPEKELIKPGGENVYPAEVEKTILEHPRVAQVAVIGVPDPEWGEAIKAICVLKEGTMEGTELREFVVSRIARYKKPKHVIFVADLPKKADGSVDREKVRVLYG